MIVHSFSYDNGQEHTWQNIFIEPVDIAGQTMYLVGVTSPGEGIPSKHKLQEMALLAETISPFRQAVTLEVLCDYIQTAVNSGTWAVPFLISEELIQVNAPTSAFEEGRADAARGMHYNANPHIAGTAEADEWDEGWMEGRDGNFDDLKH